MQAFSIRLSPYNGSRATLDSLEAMLLRLQFLVKVQEVRVLFVIK